MSQLKPIRPMFEMDLAESPKRVAEKLRTGIKGSSCCEGVSAGMHAEVFVPGAERNIWSPWLSLTVEATDGGGAKLRGRFGPHPSLWTWYMFLAFALGFGAMASMVWGLAQWALGASPWALTGILVSALLGLTLYGCSVVGQRLGGEQMNAQREFVTALLGGDASDESSAVSFRE